MTVHQDIVCRLSSVTASKRIAGLLSLIWRVGGVEPVLVCSTDSCTQLVATTVPWCAVLLSVMTH